LDNNDINLNHGEDKNWQRFESSVNSSLTDNENPVEYESASENLSILPHKEVLRVSIEILLQTVAKSKEDWKKVGEDMNLPAEVTFLPAITTMYLLETTFIIYYSPIDLSSQISLSL
jgi:hypothetical protein